MQICKIALLSSYARSFDYSLEDEQNCIKNSKNLIGRRVLVDFRGKKIIGMIVAMLDDSHVNINKIKPVEQILEDESLFSNTYIDFLHFVSSYYQCDISLILQTCLAYNIKHNEKLELSKNGFVLSELGERLLQDYLAKKADKVNNKEFTATDFSQFSEKFNLKLKLKSVHLELLEQVKQQPFLAKSKLNLLLKHALVTDKIIEPPSYQSQLQQNWLNQANKHSLNNEQEQAYQQIKQSDSFCAFLLYGITGSGKTEVYLQVIADILAKQQQVLVLVPEIALTMQAIERFQARFNLPIEIIHSYISKKNKALSLERIRLGKVSLVIGTRSAVFAPFTNLGLIVVDEEHDLSYKQMDETRYNARDLAVWRAKQLNIPIILGSATPSFESVNNANLGRYKRLDLTERASGTGLAKLRIVDMHKQLINNGISKLLEDKIRQTLAAGNKALLFLNRRGFAPVLLCQECGWKALCPDCDKPYTYHKEQQSLICHHCNKQVRLVKQCVSCGSTNLFTCGIGTEQLEQDMQQIFPQYEIVRIDKDTSSSRTKLSENLAKIENNRPQLLIGTQMLSKGHHFSDVTLVAMINVDGLLFSLDYRSFERLAQLYLQVSGRAGRGDKSGEVWLQTHFPEHKYIQDLAKLSYIEIANSGLIERKNYNLPPFSAQVVIIAEDLNETKVMNFLRKFCLDFSLNVKQQHPNFLADLQISDPMPCLMVKRAKYYRYFCVINHKSRVQLHKLLQDFRYNYQISAQINVAKLILDIDPQDLS